MLRYLKRKLPLALTALLWIAPSALPGNGAGKVPESGGNPGIAVANSDTFVSSPSQADSVKVPESLLKTTEVKESTWSKLKELFR